MAEAIVTDWLNEYKNLEEDEMQAFVSMHETNQEIADALYTILNERLKYPDIIHLICHQFHSFYRSNNDELKRFTLQFIPILIYIYLNSVAIGDKKCCRSIETLILSVFNAEVMNDDGSKKIVSFRMPVLAQASIYHEEKTLHSTDLRRWEENCNKEVKWGPQTHIESLNSQNRMKVMTALLFAYNQQLSLISKSALFHLCRIASQLVNQGFSKIGHAHRSSYGSDPNSSIAAKPLPRIPLSSQFLLELLHAIYFAMFNDFGTIAIQTMDDIHNRACYEMYPDLILVTNSVKNSLHANPSGQPSDGPMGLSVALTPATQTVTVSKSMITNASFRTKKLPDDIPIQSIKDDPTGAGAAGLMSITEEGNPEPQPVTSSGVGARNSIIRSSKEGLKASKALLPGFKKSKDKEKDKQVTIPNKNGIPNVVLEVKEPPKPPPKKERSRGSIQLTTAIEFVEFEKAAAIPPMKSKSQNVVVVVEPSNGIVTSTGANEILPLQNIISNGSISDDMAPESNDTVFYDAASDSHDSSADNSVAQRPSLPVLQINNDSKHQVQISQL